MDDTSINAFNLKIRQTPWYQAWFQQRGLNPNMVKLNDRQRAELAQVVQQQTGFQLPKDMKIDPAGNLNEKGGWAGLPTGVKIALIAGAAAATGGAALALTGPTVAPTAIGMGGATAAKGAGAAASIGLSGGGYGAGTVGSILGAGGGGGAASGLGFGSILGAVAGPSIGLASNYFANRAQTNAAERVATAQQTAAERAAELERQAAADQLAFLKEQEARRQMEWQTAQDRNFDIWNKDYEYRKQQDALARQLQERTAAQVEAQRAFERQQQEARVGRLKPFVDFGTGSMRQLSFAPGSVGAAMGAA